MSTSFNCESAKAHSSKVNLSASLPFKTKRVNPVFSKALILISSNILGKTISTKLTHFANKLVPITLTVSLNLTSFKACEPCVNNSTPTTDVTP